MPKAYLVLPQGYDYDDFYYFESRPHCAQPEAIFKTRDEAEHFLATESARVLKKWDVPIHILHTERNESLPVETLSDVKRLLNIEDDLDLAEYFPGFPDLAYLSVEALTELIRLLNIKVLCIVEAEISESDFADITDGIREEDPTRVFRQKVSDNFDLPIDEYEPFPDD